MTARQQKRPRLWEIGSCGALLAALGLGGIGWFSSPHAVRALGFKGTVQIPSRGVSVEFEGDTCVGINTSTGRGHCCIGHNS